MNRPILSLFVFALVAGCGEPVGSDGTTPSAAAQKPRPAKGAEVASVEATEEYYYNPAGKRDPFQSFLKKNTPDDLPPDTPPLQRWDLDKYVLRGVIWNTQSPRALVIDPESTGHVVKVGTYVGRNWGRITSISEGCVVITEEFQTPDGELVVNPVTMCFPSEARK